MISEVDLGPWWRTTQNGVVGKSKVEESNMENFGPNLLDGDDTALEAVTYSRHFPKRIGTFSKQLFSFSINSNFFLGAHKLLVLLFWRNPKV